MGLGCSSQVGRVCLPAGTYVDFDAGVGTVTARICFGADCQTTAAGVGESNKTTGFYRSNDFDGNSTVVDILVFNLAEEVVGQISERRSLTNAPCGVFGYWWEDGQLRRQT